VDLLSTVAATLRTIVLNTLCDCFGYCWCLAGKLSVLYLGSEPPKQSISFSESKQLDYAAMEAERKALLAQIKIAGGAGWDPAAATAASKGAAAGAAAAKDLVLRAQVPSRLDSADRIVREDGMGLDADGVAGFGATVVAAAAGVKQLTVTLLLSNTTKSSMKASWCSWWYLV
jgi:hypothetical protein